MLFIVADAQGPDTPGYDDRDDVSQLAIAKRACESAG